LVKGNYQIAVDALRKGMKASPNFDFGIILAKALTKSGNYNEAIHLYEYLLSNYTERFRLYQGIESVKAYYYLGIAYENANQISKAKTQYKKFIGIWKNADTKFDSIEDAKKRLLQLNKGT
ncbi:MAG: tetratricopeptide repeat protein, partial [candidate division Zixibacteria bacterium]|nr:tetratricopeptide repeat protein [candidate division Zixibacteria bacterium]